MPDEEKRYDVESVKEMLVDYREREKDIVSQTERLQRMEIRLRSVGAPTLSDMPKSPSPVDRTTELICDKIDLENELKQLIQQQRRRRQYIETVLRHVKNSDERTVIRAKYFDGEGWYGINDLLFGAKEDFIDKEESYLRRAHLIHGTALIDMAKYMESNPIPDDLKD